LNQGKVHQFDRQIKILFIAAEAEPFVKVGGLGDVAGSLPVALKQLAPQLDIRLAIPFYDSIGLVLSQSR
jgi:starch synthase